MLKKKKKWPNLTWIIYLKNHFKYIKELFVLTKNKRLTIFIKYNKVLLIYKKSTYDITRKITKFNKNIKSKKYVSDSDYDELANDIESENVEVRTENVKNENVKARAENVENKNVKVRTENVKNENVKVRIENVKNENVEGRIKNVENENVDRM